MANDKYNGLLGAARDVARLQARRRRLRRELKQINADLKHANKMLRAFVNQAENRRPDAAPSRVFGPGVGLVNKTGTDDPLS